MIKKYIDHMHTKTPHERRQHAMQVAFVATGLIALVWIGTLGYRFSAQSNSIAQSQNSSDSSQVANAGSALPSASQSSLEAATTSVFNTSQ